MPKYSIITQPRTNPNWIEKLRIFQTTIFNRLNIDVSNIFEATDEDVSQILEIAKEIEIKIILNKK
ncbi:MAG: hypothetical protein IJE06_06800 [Alistipes sp.]|nr:hypothetical protein [Alistipes sp.]